jgi:large subunit ribosomal protein LP0
MSDSRIKLLKKKAAYFEKVQDLLATYNKAFIIHCDNVGSKQISEIRMALRGEKPGDADKATMLMGKNTMIRKAFSMFLEKNEGHPCASLVPLLVGNVGIIFTNNDLNEIAEIIRENKKEAPAKAGAIAPVTVVVPAGPTGADPGATAFFQALQIPTKISRGQIEITAEVTLVREGEKVNSSHAALLQRLDMKPFFYGLSIQWVYDNGSLFGPDVLALTDDAIIAKFLSGVRNIAALGLKIGYPTLASIPHSLSWALKHLVAIVCADEVNYSFEKAEPYLAYLADPSAFAAAAGPAAGGEEAAAAAEEEEEEEEEADMGTGGLFDDSDDDW